jgi:glycosyltransferase involved in cell wall biosynthesis
MNLGMIFKFKISIITVVFNGEATIENTIQSVLNQSYSSIEYIIIDGKSKDGTLEIIKRYQDQISVFISEPDKGLYDAMNKGLDNATGEYVLFLNSGDVLHSKDVLKKIFTHEGQASDVYYGETVIINELGMDIGMRRLEAPEHLTWKSLIDGMLVCHQSFIVKKSISPDYNLKYKIAADYDWMINCLKSAESIRFTHLIISKFLDGGLNKQNISKALFERFIIMIHHYNFFLVVLNHFRIAYRFALSYLKNRRF